MPRPLLATLDTLPYVVLGFPVLEAMRLLDDPSTHPNRWLVIVERPETVDPFVVWLVWPDDDRLHGWHAENGSYCATWEDAYKAFAKRLWEATSQ